MTATPARKYNPGFLSDEELVASFCVRTHEFESLIEMLRDCTGNSNRHQIVIGPRGSGKTSLLLRIAAEVRRDADLAASFFPVVFAEESYEVSTAGEFWLECLARLADQAPQREDVPDLQRAVADLRTTHDDQALGERCLAAVLDFADREEKRLVLMVENLNMMFRDMMDPDAGWRLRKVLQTEPRIILLGSATSRFDEIDKQDHALYELLRVLTLRPLNTDECALLWKAVSGQNRPTNTIRSLEILTGGSPRLLAIVARFGAGLSFRELMSNLLNLVDDHTEYFKSHLESLPAQERRVYLALADLWKPALTREIAERARLATSKCSAQLMRLVERGVVLVAGGSARRKQYYLSERMYNIYYLLRRGQDRLVEVLIRFMASYYSPDELNEIGNRIAREAEDVEPGMRSLYQSASAKLVAISVQVRQGNEKRVEMGAGPVDDAHLNAAKELFDRGLALWKRDQREDALAALNELLERFGRTERPALLTGVAKALFNKAVTLGALNRTEEELAVYDEVLNRFGDSEAPELVEVATNALINKGLTFGELNRREEELAAYDELLHRFGDGRVPDLLGEVAKALFNKAAALGALNRHEEGLSVYDEVLRQFGDIQVPEFPEVVAEALFNKAVTLGVLSRWEQAVVTYDEVVRRIGDGEAPDLHSLLAKALVNKGIALDTLGRLDEEIATYDEVQRRFGDSAMPHILEPVVRALLNKGIALGALNRRAEALSIFDGVIRRFGRRESPEFLELVAEALFNKGVALGALNRREEELAAYEEVVRRFDKREMPVVLKLLARALVNKGATLGALNKPEEELATYDEVSHRFGESGIPDLLESVARALLHKGFTLSELNRQGEALATYDEVVRRFGKSDVPEILERVAKALTYKVRILAEFDRTEASRNAAMLLEFLSKLGSLPVFVPDDLMELSIALGPKPMLGLITASPASDLLLALTTALEREVGQDPRVPQEISEVAEDIRRDLAKIREARSGRGADALSDLQQDAARRGLDQLSMDEIDEEIQAVRKGRKDS